MKIKIYLVLSILVLFTNLSFASVQFYFDETSWLQDVSELEIFELSGLNLSFSEELTSIPQPDTTIGSILTFPSTNTSLSRDFKLTALESGAQFVFDGNGPFSEGPSPFTEVLWMGPDGQSQFKNDDFQVDILSGSSLYAFAFDLIDNTFGYGPDFLSIYGPEGLLSSGLVPEQPEYCQTPEDWMVFVGVIADSPIDYIIFDEDDLLDSVGIRNLRFATPEPATILLLTFGSLFLRKRKRK